MEEIAPVFAPVFEDAKENTTWKDNEVNAQALKYVENASGYYGYPVKTLKGRTVAAKHYFTYPFVKAEVVNYQDLLDCGSYAGAREKGLEEWKVRIT